jgi:predicted dehydrogenase
MNFLLLGLGSIGRRHAAILRRIGHSVTTVDPDPEAGADYQGPHYATHHNSFDGVLDCTPPDVRAIWPIPARARFIEKPLGRLFPGTSVHLKNLMMGFCYHWDESLREFVQIVKGAKIHALRIEGGQYLQDWHEEDYQSVKHRYHGVVTDSLPHSIYIARWILGDVRLAGYIAATTEHFDVDVEDCAAILLTGPKYETCYLYADYPLTLTPSGGIITGSLPPRTLTRCISARWRRSRICARASSKTATPILRTE